MFFILLTNLLLLVWERRTSDNELSFDRASTLVKDIELLEE